MKVAIAGAGNVGRSIARELIANGHHVMLIDKDPKAMKLESVAEAEWVMADACEIAALDNAKLDQCQVLVAATGDDKVNLVASLLAKTEYGVPRVVARINHPKNEWMFDSSWGVDVAVSTPQIITALVEEAVARGANVKLIAANLDYYVPGIDIVRVSSTAELIGAVEALDSSIDFAVMPAAVSDFRVDHVSEMKLKKSELGAKVELALVENPDVITLLGIKVRSVNANAAIVGFAAETLTGEELKTVAKTKLAKKNLDFIVANEVSSSKGFDTDFNDVIIIGKVFEKVASGTKRSIAKAIFDLLVP